MGSGSYADMNAESFALVMDNPVVSHFGRRQTGSFRALNPSKRAFAPNFCTN
jgi:hypothetical protein